MLRLHVVLVVYGIQKWISKHFQRCCRKSIQYPILHQLNWLPWEILVEKFAENRRIDIKTFEEYIQALLRNNWACRSEPLLAFLEVSPLRFQSMYGPSLKEGYVHLKTNGAEHFPFYRCTSRMFANFYHHCYRLCLMMNFIACFVCVLAPLLFVALVYVPYSLFQVQSETTELPDGSVVNDKASTSLSSWSSPWYALLTFVVVIFLIGYIFKFFQRRLGTVRRWTVLKPTCLVAFKNRADPEPSAVFLFDEDFKVAHGSYRQGVTWMPNGLTIASKNGILELDTGVYYTRLTAAFAILMATFVVVYIGQVAWFQYQSVPDAVNVAPFNSSGIPSDYCGLYFIAPVDLYIRPMFSDTLISEMVEGSPGQLEIEALYSFIDSVLTANIFTVAPSVITRVIPSGSLVGLSRLSGLIDSIGQNNTNVSVQNIGILQIRGMISLDSSVRTYLKAAEYCVIDFEVAPFVWTRVIWIVITFVLGGILAISVGLGINYMLSTMGLWHAHVRRDQWIEALRKLSDRNIRLEKHKYGSFAPPRLPFTETSTGTGIQWHIDGDDTFRMMYEAMEQATHQIFIAGWWLCPDLYLKRPPDQFPESKLKDLILRKAESGVLVYVLLYREVKVVLTLNSGYARQQLRQHKNIRVLRDPQFHLQHLGFWSHHEKLVVVDQKLAFVGGLDLCFGRYDTPEHNLAEKTTDSVWPGKDYSNPRVKDFIDVHRPMEDLIDRNSIPRMPWHDIHCSISGEAAQDVALHFIQRWNYVAAKSDYRLRTGFCICCRTRRFRNLPKCIVPLYVQNELSRPKGHKPCHAQVIRSVSKWSAGVPLEQSIQIAYSNLIRRAERFIYIENQFFISGLNGNRVVSNRILQAIVDRVVRAIQEQDTQFRVYILMPLLPAFEGNVHSNELTNLHAVMHWQYATISRGSSCLLGELKKHTNKPEDHVSFFGLRNYGVMPDQRLTCEQIYIHSKLLLVDDEKVIIGSANINDRSMNGNRDSEVGLVIEDPTVCKELRVALFKEHLGGQIVDDPCSNETWRWIQSIAKRNTAIFEDVFQCAPSNTMKTFTAMVDVEIEQLYENQRFNALKGPQNAWDAQNLKPQDYAAWTDINGVPLNLDRIDLDDFVVHTKLDPGVLILDNDGWMYARNFSTFQEVRLGESRVARKREKLQHFMTDRVFALVRRRCWIRRDLLENSDWEGDTDYTPLRSPKEQSAFSRTLHSIVDYIPRARSYSSTASVQRSSDHYIRHPDLSPVSATDLFRATSRSMSGLSHTSCGGSESTTQLGMISTLASVSAQQKATGQLSLVQGHLVEFPVDFLADEILKPAILPRDIHI